MPGFLICQWHSREAQIEQQGKRMLGLPCMQRVPSAQAEPSSASAAPVLEVVHTVTR